MTQKVFSLDTQPGIQRDGTIFDRQFYTDGRWVRFQRGRPRKMFGYRRISDKVKGPSRGIWVNAQNGFNYVFSGYASGLQVLTIDDAGVGAGITDIALSNFTANASNLWQFDGFYNVTGGVASLVAHPGRNLGQIDSTINAPVLIGDINGTTMSQIGVFTDSLTLNGTTTATLAASNIRIGAGQTVTGTNIPAGTTVVSVVSTTVTLSQAATGSGTVTATFNNNISVSGGVVVLHPYVFVYGNDGLIQNCSAGDPDDWVSADANATNAATGKIVKGLPVRGGSNSPSGLFWSLDSLIRVSYAPQSLGVAGTANFAAPTFWRYDIISSQTSIMSSSSVIEYDGIYYWCGVDRFLLYNGVVKEIPNPINQNWFFDNLNYSQRQKVWATKVPRFGEIWWFYPRGDSTECNDAVIYNVRENCWYDAGQSMGARRSAGYFSQVFAYPVEADWSATVSEVVTTVIASITAGSPLLFSFSYNSAVAVDQIAQAPGIPSGSSVVAIRSSGIKTTGVITGGSGYANGTYSNVPLTGGSGAGAEASITISGGSVTAVSITNVGSGYVVGDVLSAQDSDLGGLGGGGFSVPVASLYEQIIELSANATSTSDAVVTFSTPPGLIKLYQHEVGRDAIDGSQVLAIESYVETNDLGWVSGGPSQVAPEGPNRWLRLERVEPDFIMSGEMELYVTGRPYAQSEDDTSAPYVFDQDTNKIDMREQRRELRLKFRSNVAGGDYQFGKIIVNADVGDVRGY
jgi:hypothetical protein